MAVDPTLLETDPLDIAIDPQTGNLLIGPDGCTFVSGIEGVAQLVRFRLSLFQGEWPLNLDAGIPYYDELLGEKFNLQAARDIFTNAIADVPGVESVTSIGVVFNNRSRQMTVTWNVVCEFGGTASDQTIVNVSPTGLPNG